MGNIKAKSVQRNRQPIIYYSIHGQFNIKKVITSDCTTLNCHNEESKYRHAILGLGGAQSLMVVRTTERSSTSSNTVMNGGSRVGCNPHISIFLAISPVHILVLSVRRGPESQQCRLSSHGAK
ncbi:hypothetical protein PV327_011070 [Microctonus hyperodae]|uniref:Uncharacterized protein n=1 Tax=Microctonus hyperodae TaxID=165561 RepID=A0AA39FRG8_MICHY|nr:hypothetical protein PV327_011070 [Microctonus hyperodae]